MNVWHDYISNKMDVSKELDADINYLKNHWRSHSVKQICRYRALQQSHAKRQEQAHTINLKDGWNASNHNLNHVPHIISFQHHILGFKLS